MYETDSEEASSFNDLEHVTCFSLHRESLLERKSRTGHKRASHGVAETEVRKNARDTI